MFLDFVNLLRDSSTEMLFRMKLNGSTDRANVDNGYAGYGIQQYLSVYF